MIYFRFECSREFMLVPGRPMLFHGRRLRRQIFFFSLEWLGVLIGRACRIVGDIKEHRLVLEFQTYAPLFGARTRRRIRLVCDQNGPCRCDQSYYEGDEKVRVHMTQVWSPIVFFSCVVDGATTQASETHQNHKRRL